MTITDWPKTTYFAFLLVFIAFISSMPRVEGSISCYKCTTRNGSDPNCDDPFHPAHSDYKIACKVPKEGHMGEFPANFCVKVVGTVYGTREKLVIRTCTLENMENQCGAFRYEHEHLTGCILTCQSDGCNSAPGSSRPSILLSYALIFLLSSASLF